MRKVNPPFIARVVRYYIQNTPIKFGRSLLVEMTQLLIRRKRFIDKIWNGDYYNFDLGQWIDRNLFFFGGYEKREQKFIQSRLDKTSVFMDIGANSGLYSLVASKKCSKVFAFEPDIITRRILKKNIRSNNRNNIKVIPYALTDKNAKAIFYTNPTNRGMSSLFYHGGKLKRTIVKTDTLDNVLEALRIREVTLIKMDIEGGELKALKGSVKTIERFKPMFLVEVNKIYTTDAGFQISDIYNFFQKFNYSPYSIEGDGSRKVSKEEFLGTIQKNIFFEH